MKNILGLVIALSLGLIAALLNWTYLERKSTELETVSFLAIANGQRIRPGDTFLDSHFTSVSIPKPQVGTLNKSAVKFDDRSTVIGVNSQRRYEGGEIILLQDLKTPPAELKLQKDERVMWIPVNSSTFVAGLVEPGDLVSFIMSRRADSSRPDMENEADEEPELDPRTGVPLPGGAPNDRGSGSISGGHELLGPFRILSLGNRLGSEDAFRSRSNSGARQGNVMGISVKVSNDQLEPRAKLLFERLQQSNFRQMGVLLHPREK